MEEGDSGQDRWKKGKFVKGYDPRRARAPRGPKSRPRPKSLREALRPDAEYIRYRLVQLTKGQDEHGNPMDPEAAKVALRAVEIMAKYSSAPPRTVPEEPEVETQDEDLSQEDLAMLAALPPEEAKA